ncbi:MAG: thiamine-phosphate pyrophosphorylase [Helicobacteraceae bacterium]|jgi:thiamine-phosphate pyrophosphorylase|nr:thiamine-phosphate pyrophosphorylase [Helicobacteraceae bacterium]
MSAMIDANLNRLREGVRVVEDICRFVLKNGDLARRLKNLRSSARIAPIETLLAKRDSENDVLRPSVKSESDRGDLKGVAIANFKRAQEAARVLEETLKIFAPAEAETYKNIRYELYTLEKTVVLALCENR